jgi:hypothetical protein
MKIHNGFFLVGGASLALVAVTSLTSIHGQLVRARVALPEQTPTTEQEEATLSLTDCQEKHHECQQQCDDQYDEASVMTLCNQGCKLDYTICECKEVCDTEESGCVDECVEERLGLEAIKRR